MPKQVRIGVNLGPSKNRQSIEQIFFKWALNVGRVIIIATELIALAALSFRFIMDRQIIDLHDKIKRDEIYIKSQEPKERKYRNIQSRLAYIKAISEESREKIDTLNQVLGFTNNGFITVNNLAIYNTSISMSGSSSSLFSLNSFIDAMKKNPVVTSIALDEINSSDHGINFKLSITLKESAIKNTN